MKNSIRVLMILSIVLLLSCGKEDSGSTASTVDPNLRVSDVVLEIKAENKLRASWTAPVEAERVDYYLVELRSGDTVITRRASAEATELEIAVLSGSYRTSVAVVAAGIVEPGVAGDQEQVVETKATVPGNVGMTAANLSSVMTSEEHATIEVEWLAPTEFGKTHSGTDAEPVAYILYWKKGTAVGTTDYEGTTTVQRDATTGIPATNALIEGLLPGSSYAVRVVMESTAGLRSEGVEQTIETATSQTTAPKAPIIQTASIESIGTESNAILSFSWEAPVSSGTDYKGDEAGIKEYRIYWEEGNSVSTATGETLTLLENATSVSIPGLKNETEYSFMVVVVANGGLSAESTAQSHTTAAISQAAAPSPVLNFTATAEENSLAITLGWDAHTEAMNGKKADGSAAEFVAYYLYWVEGSEAVFAGDANEQIDTIATTSYSISSSLQGGTPYTISIVVENSEGLRSTQETQQVQTKDFATSPSSITPTLTATIIGHTEAEIEVSWAVPDDPGKDSNNEAAQIEKYILTWTEGTTIPEGAGTTQELAADAERSLTLSLLEPGKTYTVAVVARNTAGQEGAAVEVSESIAASQESNPTSPVLIDASIDTQSTSTDADITVSWTRPEAGNDVHGNAASIAGYVLYWKADSDRVSPDDYTGKQSVTGAETSSRIQNLAVNTEYALLLVVVSSNGRTASSNVATKVTPVATAAVAPGMVTGLAAATVGQGAERTTALKLSWNAPGSFGQNEAGADSTLREYQIYLQASSELEVGEAVDVSSNPDYTTGDTEYTIPAEALDGGTAYRLAVVVVNSEGTRSEAVEAEGTPHDLSEAPAAVAQIYVDTNHKEANEIKIYWDPVNGKDRNGKIAAAVYEIYKGESSNGYTDAQDLISSAGTLHAIKVSTTETVNEEERVIHIIRELTPNIEYDIVVIAEHSEKAELKATPTLKAGVLSNGKIVYKPISVVAREILTANDADNPWLFMVRGQGSKAGISADIAITDRGEPPTTLYEQNDIAADSFENEGETVVGFGPSLSASSSWAAITADELRIEVIVYENSEEIERLTLEVAKGIAGGIYSWRDLQGMREDLTGDYALQNNIDFPATGTYGFGEAGFEPIGKDSTKGNAGHQGTAFSGTLDGGGYSIRGLVVEDAAMDYVGIFGKIEANDAATEVVKDLVIEDPRINANAMAGTVVGHLKAGTIVNITVRSTATTSGVGMWTDGSVMETGVNPSRPKGYIGGLVGALEAGGILQCSNAVSVNGTGGSGESYIGGAAGGLAGSNVNGTVTGYVTGMVRGYREVGGLVGNNSGTVVGYMTGTVRGTDQSVGGLTGANSSSGVVAGYMTGSVSGDLIVGGLVGFNSTKVVGYITGSVSGDSDVGALVGDKLGENTITGYWNKETTSAGGDGIGISSTDNIYYYTTESEPSGRVQNMYYDKGTGNDPNNKDSGDEQIFSDGDFPSIFELPEEDERWPKLKKSFTVNSKAITLSDAIYNAQQAIVNWTTE